MSIKTKWTPGARYQDETLRDMALRDMVMEAIERCDAEGRALPGCYADEILEIPIYKAAPDLFTCTYLNTILGRLDRLLIGPSTALSYFRDAGFTDHKDASQLSGHVYTSARIWLWTMSEAALKKACGE